MLIAEEHGSNARGETQEHSLLHIFTFAFKSIQEAVLRAKCTSRSHQAPISDLAIVDHPIVRERKYFAVYGHEVFR